jgi:hypothetical protein
LVPKESGRFIIVARALASIYLVKYSTTTILYFRFLYAGGIGHRVPSLQRS